MDWSKSKWRLTGLVSVLYLLIPFTLGVQSDVEIRDAMTFLFNWLIAASAVALLIRKLTVRNMWDLTVIGMFVLYLFILYQLVSYIPLSFYLSDGYVGDWYIMWERFNLIPFGTIKNAVLNPLNVDYVIQSGGNLVLLLPFGFVLLKFGLTSTIGRTAVACFLISCSIEGFQFVLNLLASGHTDIKASGKSRAVDIDDVILNTLGGYLGAWLCEKISRIAAGVNKN
ncbi:VanZ family protein [Indiicoccus explosivorum]|uniref:VanZ family protein n=1 Tax=Indiicoccus explosivorum TaxID=1917864 RepID=UPI0013901518|nr:VanZ family protein [Indiicoccus explosivorum]